MLEKNLSFKIEIKDKKLFIQNCLGVAVIIALASVLAWQISVGVSLKQNLTAQKSELKEAKRASKHLKRLEWQTKELEQKELEIRLRVPVEETHPFALIKNLTVLAESLGLQRSVFKIKEPKQNPEAFASASAAKEEPPASEEIPFPENGPAQAPGLIPLNFEMRSEASFGQLLKFLKEILAFKRIVSLEAITIERDKKILPYQKITLELTTYSFPKE